MFYYGVFFEHPFKNFIYMYIQKEKGFPVVQGDFSLEHKIATAVKSGVQLPDMSTPKDLGDQPLLPENERFVESADLYGLECSVRKKFGNLKDKFERTLKFRKDMEKGDE